MEKRNTITKVIFMIVQIALILIGLYIINLYIGPLISLGVINAGNLFGFGVGSIFILSGVFLNKLVDLFHTLNGSIVGKAVTTVILILSVAFWVTFFATYNQIVKHSEYTAENQSTVIVLGCQIRGSVPSSTLVMRSQAAAEYLKKHPDAIAVASGGQGADEDLSEGQCIFNLMTESGISPERILIEDKSTNTDENIKNVKRIIDENGFSTDVAVATSEYHEYRASMICKKNGLNAAAIPSQSTKRGKPTFFTREVFGIWAQKTIRNS